MSISAYRVVKFAIIINRLKCIYHFQLRCLEAGGYLANLETLEEAIFFKNLVTKMKTGNFSSLNNLK